MVPGFIFSRLFETTIFSKKCDSLNILGTDFFFKLLHINLMDRILKEMETIYENQFVKLDFDQDKAVIKIIWRGKIPFDIYKEALNFCLDFMTTQGLGQILVDQRSIQPLDEQAQKWLYKTWFPKLFEHMGTNISMAILPSPITFRNISSKSIAKKLIDKHHDLRIEYFNSEKLAYAFFEGKL